MNNNLQKLENFFRYDYEIKKILCDIAPKDEYQYSEYVNYSDVLYNDLTDLKVYFEKIFNIFSSDDDKRKYLDYFFENLKNELINCGGNFEKLKKEYQTKFANMREEFIDKISYNIRGYYLSDEYISLSECETINEMLHLVHHSIVNNESIYQSLPVLKQKNNNLGCPICLYGNNSNVGDLIYENFPLEMIAGWTDIVSLSDEHILVMVRDRGHALSIEIEMEKNKYYVRYFIPKICNIEMVNSLKGVRKVNEESNYTTGVFECSCDELAYQVIDFIGKVPTDDDMKQSSFYF